MSEKFEHKKSLGQHFLTSDYVPKKLCDAADLKKGEIVLEIGPGTGALTRELLARGVRVLALEADLRAITSLEETFKVEISTKQLVLFHHDVRSLEPAEFGLKDGQYKVVANIPYYLSGFLFRTLLESSCQPNTVVFLVQKEVALRIARAKKESLLSLSVKAFGIPTYICTVSRGHFTPPPKVDSAIIAIREISKRHFVTHSKEAFFTLLHYGFGQKRKQLKTTLRDHYTSDSIHAGFVAANLLPTIRAEAVSLSAWYTLLINLIPTESPQ